MPVPQSKGLRIALSIRTSNAKPHADVYLCALSLRHYIPRHDKDCHKHPKGRSRCFVFDGQFEFAKFLDCQNQSAK